MSVFDSLMSNMTSMLGGHSMIFVCVAVLIAVVYWYNVVEKMEVDQVEDDDYLLDTDTDVWAPAPVSAPMEMVSPKYPSSLPDVAEHDTSLAGFYEDNLRGDDGYDPDVVGKDDRYQTDNVNNGYTLGVDLNDPEYKALGVVQTANKLTSNDLLPKDKKDWFDTPQVGTSVQDANLLADATFRMGLDTVSTKRGMTTDPRGAIPVPKFYVGPWNQSSRDPDTTGGYCN